MFFSWFVDVIRFFYKKTVNNTPYILQHQIACAMIESLCGMKPPAQTIQF